MTIAPLLSALSPRRAWPHARSERHWTLTSTDIQASYFAGGGAFDLFVDGPGQVVGSVGLCRVSDSTCELRKRYLAPEVRGGGWGRWLLEHALARASELGFRHVVLETASGCELFALQGQFEGSFGFTVNAFQPRYASFTLSDRILTLCDDRDYERALFLRC